MIDIVDANSYTFTATDGLLAGEEYEVEIVAKTYITEYFSSSGATSATGTFYSSDLPAELTSLTYSGLTKTDVDIDWTLFTAASDKGYSTTNPVYTLEMDDCAGGAF